MPDAPNPARRRLLIYGLAGTSAVAAGLIGLDPWSKDAHADPANPPPPGPPPPRAPYLSPTGIVTQRRRLGRTGLDISVVGIGAGDLEGTAPLHRAASKGINYLDTSCCYGHGASENVIGSAFRESPSLRGKLVLATKWDAGARMPKERMLESLDASLKRMGTDHVDIMLIHNLGDHLPGDDGFSRLDNPELYAAMDAARKAGKARFFGASGHTGNRTDILMHAIDKGAFDMILVKMNVLDFETARVPQLLAYAKEKNVGVVSMKSQPQGGMMPPGFEASKWNVYQANLRWSLSKDIACVVHSGIGSDPAVQDAAIGAVHDKLALNEPQGEDAALLETYASALSPHYCRGCDDAACVSACPEGIAIPNVLRAVMYERHYGLPEKARETYGVLGEGRQWSLRCLSCAKCDEACPYGVDASSRVRGARQSLA